MGPILLLMPPPGLPSWLDFKKPLKPLVLVVPTIGSTEAFQSRRRLPPAPTPCPSFQEARGGQQGWTYDRLGRSPEPSTSEPYVRRYARRSPASHCRSPTRAGRAHGRAG